MGGFWSSRWSPVPCFMVCVLLGLLTAKKAKLESSTPASPKPSTPVGRSRSGRASSATLDPAPDSETEAQPPPGATDKEAAGNPPSLHRPGLALAQSTQNRVSVTIILSPSFSRLSRLIFFVFPEFVDEPPSKRTKQEIKVKIPEVLKPVLVDDWDSISRSVNTL